MCTFSFFASPLYIVLAGLPEPVHARKKRKHLKDKDGKLDGHQKTLAYLVRGVYMCVLVGP